MTAEELAEIRRRFRAKLRELVLDRLRVRGGRVTRLRERTQICRSALMAAVQNVAPERHADPPGSAHISASVKERGRVKSGTLVTLMTVLLSS
jgi:hypothetical protein